MHAKMSPGFPSFGVLLPYSRSDGVGFAAVLRDIVEWGISPIVRAELCDKQIVLAPQSSIVVSSKSLVLLNIVVCSIESIR